jgi:hypothetical protein
VKGAVPPVGVKSMAPVLEAHCELVKTNSPFTPPFTVIDGILPHFGEILFGSNGQTSLPLAVVQASQILEILITSPQVYVISPKLKNVVEPPGSGPPQPVLTVEEINAPVVPL